jgi:hypothetical protein
MALFDAGATFPLTDREVLDLRGLTSPEVRALGAMVKYRFILLEV